VSFQNVAMNIENKEMMIAQSFSIYTILVYMFNAYFSAVSFLDDMQ